MSAATPNNHSLNAARGEPGLTFGMKTRRLKVRLSPRLIASYDGRKISYASNPLAAGCPSSSHAPFLDCKSLVNVY